MHIHISGGFIVKNYESLNLEFLSVGDDVISASKPDSSNAQFKQNFDPFGFLEDESA